MHFFSILGLDGSSPNSLGPPGTLWDPFWTLWDPLRGPRESQRRNSSQSSIGKLLGPLFRVPGMQSGRQGYPKNFKSSKSSQQFDLKLVGCAPNRLKFTVYVHAILHGIYHQCMIHHTFEVFVMIIVMAFIILPIWC